MGIKNTSICLLDSKHRDSLRKKENPRNNFDPIILCKTSLCNTILKFKFPFAETNLKQGQTVHKQRQTDSGR